MLPHLLQLSVPVLEPLVPLPGNLDRVLAPVIPAPHPIQSPELGTSDNTAGDNLTMY